MAFLHTQMKGGTGMSENQNRGVRDFSMYDSMNTEELEEILRLDYESCEDEESDTELLFYVMEVLAKRKKNSNTQEITAQQAWESFQSNYLYSEDEASTPVSTEYKASAQPWLHRMIAAAAVIAILVCIPVATSAFGWEDIWNAVATWAKETFSFVSSEQNKKDTPNPKNTKHYTSLQDALDATNQMFDGVPTWIPDNYELQDIKIGESPKKKSYDAFYLKGETPLYISVQVFFAPDPEKVEIGEEPIEIYEVSGVKYYIFGNLEQKQIIWYNDSYECRITCELTIEDIKMMIDSIRKG